LNAVRDTNGVAKPSDQSLEPIQYDHDSENHLFLSIQPHKELRVVWYLKDIYKYWDSPQAGK